MDVTEETVGATDSVSSEESFSVSESTAKFSVPVKMTRENAHQNVAAVESGRSKSVSG